VIEEQSLGTARLAKQAPLEGLPTYLKWRPAVLAILVELNKTTALGPQYERRQSV
jgi:hypothetical protein